MYDTAQTLIVVYKDEMLMNQLKKMVETNDDYKDMNVGLKDDSLNTVAWTEKVWLSNKQQGVIKDKILYLGDIKGTEDLIPVLDMSFDEYGVKFGWAGKQAVLYVDEKELEDEDRYKEFLNILNNLPIPDVVKKDINDIEDDGEGFFIDFSTIFGSLNGNKKKLERQMLFYGTVKLYYENTLEAFLKS
ncbi:MAG: hypothetical protein Q4D13_05545 [Erysipelotrichaceae bacterium]|nr:hypothetical protein [Erysipelotrichaceae bacterium]